MKKMIMGVIGATALLTSCAMASKSSLSKEDTMKDQVVELLNSIGNGKKEPARYINPNKYIQHNLAVKDGLAGFKELLSQLPPSSVEVDVKRVFRDGDFVFTHTKYHFFGPKVGFDIFRYEDGKIVEHWDNLQPIVLKTVSGRTQIDGATKIIDLNKTDKNKELVRGLINNVFLGQKINLITNYISKDKYLQHNPAVGDGLEGLAKALKDLADAGMPMVYKKNHMILGEGNFVLAVSEGIFLNKKVAFYDLFRVEEGKIVEHWDTVENIPERSEWKNNNGKF